MAKKKADENKAMKPAEDKLTIRTISGDQATLEHNANFEGESRGGDHKITVCYNHACPDYRVERVGDAPCACKRTKALVR